MRRRYLQDDRRISFTWSCCCGDLINDRLESVETDLKESETNFVVVVFFSIERENLVKKNAPMESSETKENKNYFSSNL